MAAVWDGVSLDAWPELARAAAEQLHETPERRPEALRQLREAVAALRDDERPEQELSEAQLLRFLRRAPAAMTLLLAAARARASSVLCVRRRTRT